MVVDERNNPSLSPSHTKIYSRRRHNMSCNARESPHVFRTDCIPNLLFVSEKTPQSSFDCKAEHAAGKENSATEIPALSTVGPTSNYRDQYPNVDERKLVRIIDSRVVTFIFVANFLTFLDRHVVPFSLSTCLTQCIQSQYLECGSFWPKARPEVEGQ